MTVTGDPPTGADGVTVTGDPPPGADGVTVTGDPPPGADGVTVTGDPPTGANSWVDRAAARELAAAFKGVLGAVRRMRGRETRRDGCLSDAQYGLLFGLREQDEVSSGELATLADLSPATATQMLDALAAAGLVRRMRSERDRRVVLTSLTDRGHALLEERHARIAPRWNAALSGFSDDELRTAAAVMASLHTVFDELTAPPPAAPESAND